MHRLLILLLSGLRKERHMRISRRRVALGAVVAGSGAAVGAGWPAPEQTKADARRGSGSVERLPAMASADQIAAVTGNGTIELAQLGPGSLPAQRRNLNGDTVSIGLPPGFELHSVSTFMLVESQEGTYGFQSTTRGLALYSHAPEFGLSLEGIVSTGGGSLAHYKLTDATDGDLFFTVWQGPHSDIFTSDFRSLAEAVHILSGFKTTDGSGGVQLVPRPGRLGDYKIVEMSATIEFGDFVVTLEKADPTGVSGPGWPGMKGERGEFYSMHEEQPGILFVGDTALATIESWKPDDHHGPLDAHLADFLAHLSIDWRSAS